MGYVFLAALVVLISIVIFTFNYILAQSIAALCIIVLCVYLSFKSEHVVNQSLLLSKAGEIQILAQQPSLQSLNNPSRSSFAKPLNLPTRTYQLQASSRFNFIGCWLIMIPNSPATELQYKPAMNNECALLNTTPKKLFIFRDSITAQDFSRIANVIKQL